MSAHKKIIVNNFAAKNEEKPKTSPQKNTNLKIVDQNFEKLEFEKFKKLISEKIKDPKMAKKAALIISEMLNKK